MANIVDKYYQTRSSVREAVKTLRTNVLFSRLDTPLKTIVITSPTASEGKTSITCFLGIAFAETGKRVLLVETDCRRPMLANLFRQHPPLGSLQVIYGEATVMEAAVETRQKRLYLMDCGGKITNPVEFVNSRRFAAFVEEARKCFDIILFDTPPLGAFIEAALLASQCDGTILVIQPGRVQATLMQQVVEQLKKANANILGVVMNRVNEAEAGHYYYYYSRYSDKDKKKEQKEQQQEQEQLEQKPRKRRKGEPAPAAEEDAQA